MPASTTFSSPVDWVNSNMELARADGNNVCITATGISLGLKALYDGLLVWQPDRQNPDKGDVALVFRPVDWPSPLRRLFDGLAWQELPPGRLVYRGLEWTTVKAGLQQFLKGAWDAFQANPTNYAADNTPFDPLGFIPPIAAAPKDKLVTLLKSVKDNNSASADLDQAISDKIGEVLDIWREPDPAQPNDGLPVRSGKSLFKLGPPAASVELELRNLYGEPLNPLYYLKRLRSTGTPDWALRAGLPDSPRIAAAGAPIMVRTPKRGRAIYRMLNQELSSKESGEPFYRSRLAWEYQTDAAGAFTVTVSAPFNNVKPAPFPANDAPNSPAAYVKSCWEKLGDPINRCGELFEVPAELMLALIHVEGSKRADKTPDSNSFRFEDLFFSVARDYVDLRKAISEGASYTEATLKAYAKVAGGLIAITSDDEGKTEEHGRAKKIIFPLPEPYNSAAKLDDKSPAKEISWGELSEIAAHKPELITGVEITLPPSKPKSHELLSHAIGGALADAYWRLAGGIKGRGQPCSPAGLAPGKKLKPKLPFIGTAVALQEDGADPVALTWDQLLIILKTLRANPEFKAKTPALAFKLGKLKSQRTDKNNAIARAVKIKYPDLTDEQISDLVRRYLAVQVQTIKYVEDTVNSDNSRLVEDTSRDNPAFLTLAETKKLSKLYPGKMSFGIQQTLFSTVPEVVSFLLKKYGAKFFWSELRIDDPPEGDPDRLNDWVWRYGWSDPAKRDAFQLVLLAGLVKKQAATQWEGYTGARSRKYVDGEKMTMYDLPRVAAAYNHGRVEAPPQGKPPKNGAVDKPENQTDWGFWYHGNYIGSGGLTAGHGFAALQAAFVLLADPLTRPVARVRLAPILEPDAGMAHQ